MEGPPLAWGLENPRPLWVWSLANQFGIAKCSSDYCSEFQVRIFQPWQEEQEPATGGTSCLLLVSGMV